MKFGGRRGHIVPRRPRTIILPHRPAGFSDLSQATAATISIPQGPLHLNVIEMIEPTPSLSNTQHLFPLRLTAPDRLDDPILHGVFHFIPLSVVLRVLTTHRIVKHDLPGALPPIRFLFRGRACEFGSRHGRRRRSLHSMEKLVSFDAVMISHNFVLHVTLLFSGQLECRPGAKSLSLL